MLYDPQAMSLNQNLEEGHPLDTAAHPTMIGFTPVNRTKETLSADMSDREDKSDGTPSFRSKSSPSTLSSKRKQSQKLAELSKSNPLPRSRKTRRSANQSISRGLAMTKPILPRAVKSFQNSPGFSSTEDFLEAVIPNNETITTLAFIQDNKLCIPQSEPRAVLPSLGNNHQTVGLEKRTDNVVVHASEPLSHAKTLISNCSETTDRNDALYSISLQSLQSTASEPKYFEDGLQMKWNDDDFPMDDDGIREMMTLTEIKQSTSNLAFRGHFDCPCLDDEVNCGELEWLEDSVCLDEHAVFENGEDLHKVSTNRSNTVSPSSSFCNFIQNSRLPSTNRTLHGAMNDVAALDYADESFDDDDLDFELLEMTEPLCEMGLTSPPLMKSATPDHEKLRSTAVIIERAESTSEPPKVPTEMPWTISFDVEGNPVPFIRPSFPKATRDRSPILGLTTRMVLRTCFRIGEALNAASAASRSKADGIIELYARVNSSERELGSFKQNFQFSDLFRPEKPPFLAGIYVLWKGVELWDLDSKAFLGEKGRGKLARAMGRIRREERSRKWEMTILSVWPVDWDDVGIAKGIVLS